MYFAHRCRDLFAALWGAVSPLPKVSTAEIKNGLEQGSIRKILLIRAHQYIGDLILATSVFRALKENFPACELHFVGSPYNLTAVKDNRRLARLWTWDNRKMQNPVRAAAFLRELRREKFDLALVLFSNAPSFTSYLIARLSGARIIGSADARGFYGGINWSRRLTHWEAPAPSPDEPEYQKFFSVAAPVVPGPCPAPEFPIPSTLEVWAREEWEALGIQPDNHPIALFLGGNPKRRDRLWNPAAWGRLAGLIQDRLKCPVVAVCPPPGLRGGDGVSETGFYGEFRRALGRDVPVFDKPGLAQAAAFLKPMRLFLCPDGGLFHVASAAGVKTLGLFFSSDPALWKPPVPTVWCVRAPDGRPERLTPEMVLETIQLI